MKLFPRRPWITIFKEYGYANMLRFGREYQLPSKIVVQVKERRNGTFKVRAFISDTVTNEHITDTTLDYLLHMVDKAVDKEKLIAALKDYNITV